jgi:hypothetical protein
LHAGANLYVRILTRFRNQEIAFARLQQAVADADSTAPVVAQQLAKQGISGVIDGEARRRTATIRRQNAQNGLGGALREMGNAVQRYFTPEDKVAFVRFLTDKHAAMTAQDAAKYILPVAETAGFGDLEARVRTRQMMEHHSDALITLQTQRLKFAQLGAALEQYAATQAVEPRTATLNSAAEAYQSLGDKDAELRLWDGQLKSGKLGNPARYFELLLAKRPQEFVTLAGRRDGLAESAANYAVANNGATLAHAVVNAYAAGRAPVWTKAYTALVGLYFAEPTPEVNNAFRGALGTATIGERLGKPVDRSQQLAGNVWFYYGGRYGEYLGATQQGDPEDYLAAILEQTPGNAAAYATLADYYADSGQTAPAITNYQHTVELDARRPDILDRLAVLQFDSGSRTEAIAQWKSAFAELLGDVNLVRVPDRFWPTFVAAADHLRTRKLFGELQPDAETVLRAYVRKNGNYKSDELLHAAYVAAGADAAATQWLLSIVSASRNAGSILEGIVEQAWIPIAQREPIYRRIIEERQRVSSGSTQPWEQGEVLSWQLRLARYLITTRQFERAQLLLASLPDEVRSSSRDQLVRVQLMLAAKTGKLESVLAGYRAEPQNAPPLEVLRSAASEFVAGGDVLSSRLVQEFVFTREIEEHQLTPANLLGLAAIRLDTGDLPGAMELLRRLVLVVGEPFANLDSAAALLEKKHHPAEAAEFLDQLVKATPWDEGARLRLAQARIAAQQNLPDARATLVAVASSSQSQYAIRTQAAAALGSGITANLGSGELKLLAGSAAALTPAAADQPFYYPARLASVRRAGAETRLAVLSNAVADYPRREAARIPLFRAAAALDRNDFAMAALSPLINRGALSLYQAEQPSDLEPQPANPEDAGGESGDQPTEAVPLTRAQRLALTTELANLQVKLGRIEPALESLRRIVSLEPAGAAKRALSARCDELQSVLESKQRNAQRRPLIHAALEQDRLVRPQVVARAAAPPPAKRTPAQGGTR